MKRRISFKLAAFAVALTLAAFGCTTTSDEEENTQTESEFVQGDQDEVEEVVVEEVADTTASDMSSIELATVYFDFDQATIQSEARPLLRANGDQLRGVGAAIRLEGYCDERGDEEYNLALGERRAHSVKQYLENLGVDSSQMRTLSYGEAKPAVPGHTEEAWKYNRRVEFHLRR